MKNLDYYQQLGFIVSSLDHLDANKVQVTLLKDLPSGDRVEVEVITELDLTRKTRLVEDNFGIKKEGNPNWALFKIEKLEDHEYLAEILL